MMSSDISNRFGNSKETLGKFTKELAKYNKVLEDVYVTCINAIHEKFIGKSIDKRFANYVNEILAKKYGTLDSGTACVHITITSGEWDSNKCLDVSVLLPEFNYRYDIKGVLSTGNKFYRNQYRQEATIDNKFNEQSITSIAEIININRERVARHQDAYKHFDKYMKIVEKLQKQVTETLGKINPMFYGYHIDTNAYNTPNYKAFESKIKEQGGTFVFAPQEVEQH